MTALCAGGLAAAVPSAASASAPAPTAVTSGVAIHQSVAACVTDGTDMTCAADVAGAFAVTTADGRTVVCAGRQKGVWISRGGQSVAIVARRGACTTSPPTKASVRKHQRTGGAERRSRLH